MVLIIIYTRSWLPGNEYLKGKEIYIDLVLSIIALFFSFDFFRFLYWKFSLSSIERKILFLLLSLIIISSFIFNSDEFFKFGNFLRSLCFVFFLLIFFFMIPRFMFDNPGYFKTFIKLISNFGLIAAVFGLFMFLFNLYPPGRYQYVVLSFIDHPNNSSMIFTITIIPTLYYVYWKGNALSVLVRSCYIFSFILQVIAQLFTYTRAGMIATAISLLLFWGIYYRTKMIFILPIFVIIIFTFGVAFFQAKGFASFVSRFYLLIPAYQMIVENGARTLWGYGLSNALVEYRKNLIDFDPSSYLVADPHNTYVTLILMLGIIFTIVLIIFLGLLLAKCLRSAIIFKRKDISLYFIFLFSSSLSILIQGLFDAELVKVEYFTMPYLLTILGLIYVTFSDKLYRKFVYYFDRLLY